MIRKIRDKLRYERSYRPQQVRLLLAQRRRRRAVRVRGRSAHWIASSPDRIDANAVLRKIAAELGLGVRRERANGASCVVFWQDRTHRQPRPELEALAERRQVLNIRNRDISKTTVSRAFERVFGRKLLLDPVQHS